ncbi:MAG: biotin/lipoyl-binding protein [Gammaproteobacteria bacterium]|nr:biotin/lipoyl-binding protein [Gammaproteobacteria bacterium]
MKLILKFVVPVLILCGGVGAFAVLKATKPEQPSARIEERIWRVDVIPADPRTRTPTLTLYGKLETPSLFKASAPGKARVLQVRVREGDRVTRGDLLVALDERDFLPQLEQARAEVSELEAQSRSEEIRQQSDLRSLKEEKKLLQLSQQAVDRALRLHRKDLGSDSALDQAEQALTTQNLSLATRELAIADHPPRLAALEARLDRARARLAETTLAFERSQLHAPYDGIVAGVSVAEGDQVNDQDVVLTMYDPGTMEVRARIPSAYQEELDHIRNTEGQLDGEATIGKQKVRLELLRLAGEANPNGIDALFKLEKDVGWLRPGQVLRFSVRRLPQPDSVVLPFSAVYGNQRLYKLEQGRMRGIRVETLGSTMDDRGGERLLLRASQLKRGDLMVVTHLPNAIDGLRAEVVKTE